MFFARIADMTVAELIEELKKLPQDAPVMEEVGEYPDNDCSGASFDGCSVYINFYAARFFPERRHAATSKG